MGTSTALAPSLRLYLDDDMWHCLGCGQTGDVVEWVHQSEGVGWREAVRILDSGRLLANAWAASESVPARRALQQGRRLRQRRCTRRDGQSLCTASLGCSPLMATKPDGSPHFAMQWQPYEWATLSRLPPCRATMTQLPGWLRKGTTDLGLGWWSMFSTEAVPCRGRSRPGLTWRAESGPAGRSLTEHSSCRPTGWHCEFP
jgi:hypothetical protein